MRYVFPRLAVFLQYLAVLLPAFWFFAPEGHLHQPLEMFLLLYNLLLFLVELCLELNIVFLCLPHEAEIIEMLLLRRVGGSMGFVQCRSAWVSPEGFLDFFLMTDGVKLLVAFVCLVKLVLFILFWEETAFWSGTEDHWPMDFLVSCAGSKLLSCGERSKTLQNFSFITFLFLIFPCLVLLMIGHFNPFSWRPQRPPILILLKHKPPASLLPFQRLLILNNFYGSLRDEAIDSFLILFNKIGKYLELIFPLPLCFSLLLFLNPPLEVLALLTDKIIIHQILSIMGE